MTNEQDADKVQSAIKGVWGVREVYVSLPNQQATLSFNENSASYEDVLQAIIDTGFNFEEPHQ